MCYSNYQIERQKERKKRGVVISTKDHHKTVSKSKSAQIYPIAQQAYNQSLRDGKQSMAKLGGAHYLNKQILAQSNLLSEQPQKLVNQAYYTYQDPDHNLHQDIHKFEDNQEYVIQSMQKRNKHLQDQRKQLEKIKLLEKVKNSQTKSSQKIKQKSLKRIKQEATTEIKRFQKNKQNYNKREQKNKNTNLQIREQFCEISKPRPLVFSVNMLAKGKISPRSHHIDENIIKLSQKISNSKTSRVSKQQTFIEDSFGENLNCKKLPFRFQGII